MLFWTHTYDLLAKLFVIALIVALIVLFPVVADQPILLFGFVTLLYFGLYHFFIRTLASWLYCTFTLNMKLSLKQAATLNNGFSPTFGSPLKWLPQKELRNMEGVDKYALALANLATWEAEQKAERQKHIQQFKKAGVLGKTSTLLLPGILTYLFVASIANWPPANTFADLFCWLFDTDSYYPMLNFALLALAVIFLFLELEKLFKKKDEA